MLDQQNHAAGGANSSIMVGMFVCLCLVGKKPSQQEFFVPAEWDLGAKLLKRVENFNCLVICSNKMYSKKCHVRKCTVQYLCQ